MMPKRRPILVLLRDLFFERCQEVMFEIVKVMV